MDLTTSPFKRLREATGLNGQKFTEAAALSRTTTVYLDAGLFLVPRGVAALERLLRERQIDMTEILESEYDASDLEVATAIWQRAVRKSHHDQIRAAVENDGMTLSYDVSPFDNFARAAFGTRDAFCKAMKVQTGPITLWIDKDLPLPVMLKTALLDGGLTPAEVSALAKAVDEWKAERDGAPAA